ncbi:NAD(P)H-binding protein [Streptomyces sp. NPDC005386]|uniref:NAD(P)H-binding protein n=1 Tax=Streptomyces sp. NPDC005386 TaxID=3154562 RepID=UPI0033B2E7BD
MKLVLFGATGMVGSRIATEASARGHQVVAVSRSGQSPVPGIAATAADASDPAKVAELVADADAVASACVPPRDGSDPRGTPSPSTSPWWTGCGRPGCGGW